MFLDVPAHVCLMSSSVNADHSIRSRQPSYPYGELSPRLGLILGSLGPANKPTYNGRKVAASKVALPGFVPTVATLIGLARPQFFNRGGLSPDVRFGSKADVSIRPSVPTSPTSAPGQKRTFHLSWAIKSLAK